MPCRHADAAAAADCLFRCLTLIIFAAFDITPFSPMFTPLFFAIIFAYAELSFRMRYVGNSRGGVMKPTLCVP
jgi:hypothetical protein